MYDQKVALDEAWLQMKVAELDNEDVIGIVVEGSYARGDATPYSDIDFICFVADGVDYPWRMEYHDGYLLSIASKYIATARDEFTHPEIAYNVIPSIRSMRILLDKDGSIQRLQEEARAFTWEPLQEKANKLVSEQMICLVEVIHKLLSCLLRDDELELASTTIRWLHYFTYTITIQRGILVETQAVFFQTVQEAVGLDSAWTHYHRIATGIGSVPEGMSPIKARAIAILYLYCEMVNLLGPIMQPEHRATVEQTVHLIHKSAWYL